MKSLVLLLLVIVFSYGIGQWLNESNDFLNVVEKNYACNPVEEVCVIENDVVFKFEGEASALKPFFVSVQVDSEQPENIKLMFEMDGMEMGFNEHYLKRDKNIWRGEVILPVCSLGRNDWVVSMNMIFSNKVEKSLFKFSQMSK